MRTPTHLSSIVTFPLTICAAVGLVQTACGGGVITSLTQAELESAVGEGGTVLFDADGTVSLSRTVVITKDVSLDADGHHVTISGGGVERLFQLNTNVQLELKGLVLSDGLAAGADGQDGGPAPSGQDGYGGGILNVGGTLTLLGCGVSNCIAQGGNAGSGQITGEGGRGFGAGLCNLGGQVYVTNCTFAGNRATSSQGSISNMSWPSGSSGNGMGGAIWSKGGVVGLHNVSFLSNQASALVSVSLGFP